MGAVQEAVSEILGVGTDSLAWWQMALRAVIIYVVALALVRLGEKRFLGKSTAFDVIVGFMLGSLMSRAITSTESFLGMVTGGLVLVVLHWLFAVLSFHSGRFGDLVKGEDRLLILDGEIQWDAMRKSHISRNDLVSAMRRNAKLDDPEQVKIACLERNGDISVLPRETGPKVVEVRVEDGVQVVRIEVS